MEQKEVPSRFDLFMEHQRQAWQDIQSGSDEYDKSILTLSSGGLGLSLSFIKDIVPLGEAVWLPSLLWSWFAFTGAILLTILSFRLSIRAQEKHVQFLREYYLEEKKDSFNKPSWESTALKILAWGAGGLFSAAVILTTLFTWKNIDQIVEYKIMDNKDDSLHGDVLEGRDILQMTPRTSQLAPREGSLHGGREPISMTPEHTTFVGQNVEQKGRQPVGMTPAPAPTGTPSGPLAPAAGNQASGGGGSQPANSAKNPSD